MKCVLNRECADFNPLQRMLVRMFLLRKMQPPPADTTGLGNLDGHVNANAQIEFNVLWLWMDAICQHHVNKSDCRTIGIRLKAAEGVGGSSIICKVKIGEIITIVQTLLPLRQSLRTFCHFARTDIKGH